MISDQKWKEADPASRTLIKGRQTIVLLRNTNSTGTVDAIYRATSGRRFNGPDQGGFRYGRAGTEETGKKRKRARNESRGGGMDGLEGVRRGQRREERDGSVRGAKKKRERGREMEE